MRAVMLSAILLVAGLAGCLGGEDTQDEVGTSSTSTSGTDGSSTIGGAVDADGNGADAGLDELGVVTYEGLDTMLMTMVSENGEFAAGDQAFPAGWATGNYEHRYPLDPPGPPGTPIHITAEMTTEGGSPRLWLDTADATVYSMSYDVDDGTTMMEAVVLPGSQPMEAVVQWFGFPPSDHASYEFMVHLMAHHDIAFSGVAVALPLGPGDLLVVEDARGSEAVDVVLYGPDGQLFLRETASGTFETTLPPEASEGDYIVLSPPGGPDFRISSNATETTMTPVPYAVEFGEPQQVQAGQPAEWTFDLTEPPLAVGLRIEGDGPTAWRMGSWSASLASPAGVLLEIGVDCTGCLNGGGSSWAMYGSRVADPKLVPGTYEASFDQDVSNELTVTHYVVTFAR